MLRAALVDGAGERDALLHADADIPTLGDDAPLCDTRVEGVALAQPDTDSLAAALAVIDALPVAAASVEVARSEPLPDPVWLGELELDVAAD